MALTKCLRSHIIKIKKLHGNFGAGRKTLVHRLAGVPRLFVVYERMNAVAEKVLSCFNAIISLIKGD